MLCFKSFSVLMQAPYTTVSNNNKSSFSFDTSANMTSDLSQSPTLEGHQSRWHRVAIATTEMLFSHCKTAEHQNVMLAGFRLFEYCKAKRGSRITSFYWM